MTYRLYSSTTKMGFITIDDEPQAVLYPLVSVHCKAFPSCSPMTLHRAPHPMQRASIPSDAERPAQFSALLDGYHHARKDAYLYLALALIMIHDATDDHERLRMDQQFEEHILNSKGEDGLQPIVGNRSKLAHRILISDWLTYSAPSVWPLIRSAGPSIKVLAEVLRDEHCKDRYFLRLFAHRLVSQPNRSRKFIRELVLTLWGVHLRPIEEISARQWEGRTQLLVPHFEPGMSGEDVWMDTDRLAQFEHWYALTVKLGELFPSMVAVPISVTLSSTQRSKCRLTVDQQQLCDTPRRRSAKRSAREMMVGVSGAAVGEGASDSKEEKTLSLAHSLNFEDGSTDVKFGYVWTNEEDKKCVTLKHFGLGTEGWVKVPMAALSSQRWSMAWSRGNNQVITTKAAMQIFASVGDHDELSNGNRALLSAWAYLILLHKYPSDCDHTEQTAFTFDLVCSSSLQPPLARRLHRKSDRRSIQ